MSNCQQFDVEVELSLEFWRFGALKVCNCQQFDVEFELSLEFWGPWIAKTRERAKVFDEIVDSYTDFDQKPVCTETNGNAGKPTKTHEHQRTRTCREGKWVSPGRGRGGSLPTFSQPYDPLTGGRRMTGSADDFSHQAYRSFRTQ